MTSRALHLKILEQEGIRQFVAENHPDGNFTFDTFPWVNHYGDWILRETPTRVKLRKWVNDLVATKTPPEPLKDASPGPMPCDVRSKN